MLAKSSGVVLLTLPPHTSHRLQPLDRTVFGPMKCFFNRALDDFMRSNPGRSVTIYDVGGLSARAFTKALTVENITSGFRCTGIFPLNQDIFSDADFEVSMVTDRPLPQQAISTPEQADAVASTSTITPQEIRPLPQAPPRRDGAPRRKRAKSAILTDTNS